MLPPYPTKNTVPGVGRYEKSQSVRSTLLAVAVDGPDASTITAPVRGSISASRRVAVYCDTTRTNTGRASWYSTRSRGMRANAERWPSDRRLNDVAWYVVLTRSRSLGRRSSDAV